jgi:hypothetical protein
MPKSLGCASSPGENVPSHFVKECAAHFFTLGDTSWGRPAQNFMGGKPMVFQTPWIPLPGTYGIFSREITIHTVIYAADIRFWPTLYMLHIKHSQAFSLGGTTARPRKWERHGWDVWAHQVFGEQPQPLPLSGVRPPGFGNRQRTIAEPLMALRVVKWTKIEEMKRTRSRTVQVHLCHVVKAFLLF